MHTEFMRCLKGWLLWNKPLGDCRIEWEDNHRVTASFFLPTEGYFHVSWTIGEIEVEPWQALIERKMVDLDNEIAHQIFPELCT